MYEDPTALCWCVASMGNCYSPTEDVLGNAPAVGAVGAWSAQELLKGTGVMYLLPRVRREGGRGKTDAVILFGVTRNLEWDMKNNLCLNPGSLSIPQP